jgi:hypothetical protein
MNISSSSAPPRVLGFYVIYQPICERPAHWCAAAFILGLWFFSTIELVLLPSRARDRPSYWYQSCGNYRLRVEWRVHWLPPPFLPLCPSRSRIRSALTVISLNYNAKMIAPSLTLGLGSRECYFLWLSIQGNKFWERLLEENMLYNSLQ